MAGSPARLMTKRGLGPLPQRPNTVFRWRARMRQTTLNHPIDKASDHSHLTWSQFVGFGGGRESRPNPFCLFANNTANNTGGPPPVPLKPAATDSLVDCRIEVPRTPERGTMRVCDARGDSFPLSLNISCPSLFRRMSLFGPEFQDRGGHVVSFFD
jgi:hypothetical protein